MFRRLTMTIFRLYMKNLVSSYTTLIMGCIQRGGRRTYINLYFTYIQIEPHREQCASTGKTKFLILFTEICLLIAIIIWNTLHCVYKTQLLVYLSI